MSRCQLGRMGVSASQGDVCWGRLNLGRTSVEISLPDVSATALDRLKDMKLTPTSSRPAFHEAPGYGASVLDSP